ncbi:hypothetical protein C7408_13228 [Paraburkholderia caballeronis]|nr:hypothetical protein C7408_13228 [Paraburkholderia caballeronis]TDV07764.1 hypothetical protein C7406_13429 [Paraburkholderia caballeronis]TDV18155.1 hypothetical protein C7404_13229 [Paraburkholderia caballeronis]
MPPLSASARSTSSVLLRRRENSEPAFAWVIATGCFESRMASSVDPCKRRCPVLAKPFHPAHRPTAPRVTATRHTSPTAPATSAIAASHSDGENEPVEAASGAATSGPAIWPTPYAAVA